jgi:hypothetical protein
MTTNRPAGVRRVHRWARHIFALEVRGQVKHGGGARAAPAVHGSRLLPIAAQGAAPVARPNSRGARRHWLAVSRAGRVVDLVQWCWKVDPTSRRPLRRPPAPAPRAS